MLAGFFAQQRVAQLDPEAFPLNSLRSLEGLTHYLLGNYQAASAAYRDHFSAVHKQYALPTNDDDEQLGLLLEKNYKKAQLLAKAALERDPSDTFSLLTVSEVALVENKPDETLAFTSTILKHEIDQFDALFLSSFAFVRKQNYGAAIDRVNLALRHSRVQSRVTTLLGTLDTMGALESLPTDQRPWCLLAQYHRYLRIFDPANAKTVRALAEKAIATGDHPADAYLALGILYSKKWQTDEALASFLQATKTDPNHAEALRWAAVTYGKRGDARNEYIFMKAAYDVSPHDSFYANWLADVLMHKLGDYQQALSLTLNSLTVLPATSDSYERLGEIYSLLGNYADSIKAYGSALRLNRKNFNAYLGLGGSFREIGNTEEAIRTYKAAIALRPYSWYPHIGLANVYHGLSRYNDAIIEYEQGIALGNNDPAQLIALCGMYGESSRFNKAVECFKKALQIRPNDVTARKRLADAEKNLVLSRGGGVE